MVSKTQLSDIDWIQAAFRALSKGGSQAVKAESIARDLSVSKGSFYWHFKDVAALKDAMLERWLSAAEDDLFALRQTPELLPADMARVLIEHEFSSSDNPVNNSWVEIAIREWARHDADAAVAIRAIDKKRLAALTELFRVHGVGRSQSAINANTLYAAWIGFGQISQRTVVDSRRSLAKLLDLLFSDRV